MHRVLIFFPNLRHKFIISCSWIFPITIDDGFYNWNKIALDKQIYDNWASELPKAINHFKNCSYEMKLENFLNAQYSYMKPLFENRFVNFQEKIPLILINITN